MTADAPTARSVALGVLERVRTSDAWANRVLPAALERAALDPRDAALATELAYGTLRRLGSLDWVISLHADRPVAEIDAPLLDVLRLGVYQLLHLDGVPDHAAVSETVALVRSRGVRGFCNAILRRVAEGRGTIPWPAPEADLAASLRIRESHPGWLVDLWIEELGPRGATALCEADNAFPGIDLRVNTARTDPETVAGALRAAGLGVRPGRWSPEVLHVEAGGRPTSWPGWDEGAFTVQDESSALVAGALGAGPGERVLDACAGPGGKTGAVAASGADVLALEVHEGRARLVRGTLGRLGLRGWVVRADATRPPARGPFDRILLDAPCSGLGVLRRRPEARWRATPEDVERAAALQRRLLAGAFDLLGASGRLVYAVCTVTRAETTDLIDGFLGAQREAELEPVLPTVPRGPGMAGRPDVQLLPHIHGTDGMYVAALRRRPA